jgi:hypothetical protein
MASSFTPHLNGLRHQRPSPNGAGQWMCTLYGEPFVEARSTLFSPVQPTWVEPKDGTARRTAAFLPTLWDDVCLLTWCDGSCAIAWRRSDGFHLLPATFSLANQIYPAGTLQTPYNDRTNDGLRMWTTENGLLWIADGIDVEADTVEAMVRAWVWERVEEVQAAPPILDPRVHTDAVGGRFAPFSPFPQPNDAVLADVEMLLTAACHLSGCDHIWATRASAPSPWRTGNTSEAVRGMCQSAHSLHRSGELGKAWRTWLKTALFGPNGVVPPSVRVAMDAKSLCDVRADLTHPTTAHAKLAYQATLQRHRDTVASIVHPDLLASMPPTQF